MVRALVTGGAGFVGANLARALTSEGWEVHLPLRATSERWRLGSIGAVLHDLDIRDTAGLASLVGAVEPDVIVNAAAHGAYSWQRDVDPIVDVNIKAVVALLEAAKAHGVARFVQLGSSSEYGFSATPPDETTLLQPNSVYATSKAAATHLVADAIRNGDVGGAVLRLYSVYGPYEEPGRLMPTLVAAAVQGSLPPLVSPDTARDFVEISDVVGAITTIADVRTDYTGPPVLNVGSGVQTTISSLVELTVELFGVAAKPQWRSMEARSWDTTAWVANIDRITAVTSWTPAVTLEQGLLRLAAWIGPHLSRYGPPGS